MTPYALLNDADFLVRAPRYPGEGDWSDESGGGAAGALVNTPTHNGDHFSFVAASSEHVTFGDVAAADVGAADSMTVLMVVRVADATPATAQYLISKRLNTAPGAPGYLARINSDGTWLAGVSDGVTNPALIAPGVAFQDGVQTVVGFQINRTTGLLRTIFDGALTTGSASIAGLGSLANAQPLTLAIRSDLAAPADVDMFAAGIWRRVLTDAEIVSVSELLATGATVPIAPTVLDARGDLAGRITESVPGLGWDQRPIVYDHPAEAITLPCVVIIPDEPWWQPRRFGEKPAAGIRLNFELHLIVPRSELASAITSLEELALACGVALIGAPTYRWVDLGQPEPIEVEDVPAVLCRMAVHADV